MITRRVAVWAALCTSLFAVSASAQPAQSACFPGCRQGFVCAKGRCVSPCNPPCDHGDVCTAQGECVAPGTAPSASDPSSSASPPARPPVPATRPSPPPAAAPGHGADAAPCLAANESAIALERDKKLRAARDQLLVCAAPTCPADVRADCARRVDGMASAIPTVVFEVRDKAGNEVTLVNVTMDGNRLVDRLDGSAVEVDPGSHSFSFEMPGQPPLRADLVIHEGAKERHELVEAPKPERKEERKPTPAEASEPHVKRTVGFVVGGAGLVALGAAVYYQVVAIGRSNDSDSRAASSDPFVQATAPTVHDQAAQAQMYAIITGVGGALAVATGVVLILTDRGSPSSAEPARSASWVAPAIGIGQAGLAAGGSW